MTNMHLPLVTQEEQGEMNEDVMLRMRASEPESKRNMHTGRMKVCK